MEIQITKVGDKLKTMRKELRLKQEDLVKHKVSSSTKDTPFTRNLVSMVETDKSPLTKKLADTIYKNLLIACEERGISFDYDFKEICMTPEDQIYRYITTYKENICEIVSTEASIKYGENLITLAEEYNLQPALSDLYRTLGNRVKNHDLEMAAKYYLKATVLKSELTDSEHISLIKTLKAIYIGLGKYSDALALALKCNINSENKFEIFGCIFNDILCLKKLGRYDDALLKISEISDQLQNEDKKLYIKAKMIEANILDKKEDVYNAMKIYNSLLAKCKSDESFILLRSNLIRLKIGTGSCTLSDLEEFSNLDLPKSLKTEVLTQFYKNISEGYEEYDINKSVYYFKKSVNVVLSERVISAETKHYFTKLLESLMANEAKMNLFLEDSPDNFKMLIASCLTKDLLSNDTVFKVLLYFQNRKDYTFVGKLLESKVS